jgi:diguanylate cyclase (GGDEF)-like protein
MGLDITSLSAQLLPVDYGVDEVELYILDSTALTNFVEVDEERAGFEDLTAMLLGVATDEQGEQLGILVKIDTVSGLVDGADTGNLNGLEFALRAGADEQTIGGSVNRNAQPIEAAALVDERTLETAGLMWRIDVWAPASYLDGTGIGSQLRVWFAGFGIIVAALLLAWRRQLVRLRLDSAHFELEHARTLASTDALTGLLNRNGLVDSARTEDSSTPAPLFFIALDGFKAVNDSEGHERGDQLLRAVANALRAIFRSEDLVCRIGGDEFVVFARRSAPDEFMKMASERITKNISALDERVTCSVGVSSRPGRSGIDVKDMLRRADGAMYEAKRQGGDRYQVVSGSA